MSKILAFAASIREGSYNKMLLSVAVDGAREAGADVTLINLADYDMPLMNQDLEAREGLPEKAKAFKTLVQQHDALLIASPEYNSGFSPLLKNCLDWASRSEHSDEPAQAAFHGKSAALLAASTGSLGGMRGLVMLRMLLANMGVMILPKQAALPHAGAAFDANGRLKDVRMEQRVRKVGMELALITQKLRS